MITKIKTPSHNKISIVAFEHLDGTIWYAAEKGHGTKHIFTLLVAPTLEKLELMLKNRKKLMNKLSALNRKHMSIK